MERPTCSTCWPRRPSRWRWGAGGSHRGARRDHEAGGARALLRLPGGITLVDDSYNSSPAALKKSLETIAASTGSARKIAVLGEMLELGAHADRLHEECGRAAAAAGLDLLIAVGGDPAARLADAARSTGMDASAVIHVATSAEAAELAMRKVRPGDLILVKGSRGIRTDHVVDRLKVEFG